MAVKIFNYLASLTLSLTLILCSCISRTDLPFEIEYVSGKVPEELLGNWMAGENGNWLLTEGANDLIISEDSVTWLEKQYAIIDVHPLVNTYRVLAVSGSDTIAIFVAGIKKNILSAAVVDGLSLPLDETGELLPGEKSSFIRWWYPLGEKYPVKGTSWTYSYYRYLEQGHGSDYHRTSRYLGNVYLEVLESDSGFNGSMKLSKTVYIDTMEYHYWGFDWDYENDTELNIRQDTIATNYVYTNDEYTLLYSNDTLFIAQDTANLVVSPLRVLNNSRIYMHLFSTNNESYLSGRDIVLEREKGITEIGFEDSFYGITVHAFKFQMKLLNFQPGR